MPYTQEFTSGAVGLVLGFTTPPETDWFFTLHDVAVVIWPVIYGGLMAFGTHVAKRIINYYSQKRKNKNETN